MEIRYMWSIATTSILLTGSISFHSAAYAALGNVGTIEQERSVIPSGDLVTGSAYQFNQDVKVTPYAYENDDGSQLNNGSLQVNFKSGEGFIYMGRSITDAGINLVRIGRDSNDGPDDLYVRAEDIPVHVFAKYVEELDPTYNAALEEGPEDDLESDTASIEDFTLEGMQEARNGRGHWGVRKKSKSRGGSYCTLHPRAKGCCYSAVKGALLSMGLVKYRLPGQAARTATKYLGKGWRRVNCGQRSRPVRGMTCSFAGGQWGHTEVFGFKGKKWYYGAHNGAAMNSPKRRCIECKVPAR